MLESDYQGVVLSFDGATKTSTRVGSWGCVLWQLPGWEVLDARGFILEDGTVNDAEYHGLLNGLKMASERGVEDLVAVGDSSIVIQQIEGLINCNRPNLQRRLAEYEVIRTKFKTVQLVHVKRLHNQAADYLTSKTLALDMSWQFGASSKLRHDQDPRFMSEVFSRFRDMLGSRQRATLAYRPQANGQQERSFQMATRSVRAYVAASDQWDWDEHAERLMFALNTSFNATRLDTPFYLVHG
ncbi:unnamed protein product [Phytophthora fragariaefolia]|uniref:Unnamed protein product n=1 Tax=Phytophthora fragariaefolia TaxID=1490495 RepID=A0A9W6WSP5_9STRA|nr:unnamed protein product [Phytophthora fragariaefolia]